MVSLISDNDSTVSIHAPESNSQIGIGIFYELFELNLSGHPYSQIQYSLLLVNGVECAIGSGLN